MTEEQLRLISYLARDGLSLENIRKKAGIKKNEWKRYLKENPTEKTRLTMLRLNTDYAVEDALLKRALGYRVEEYRESEKPNGQEAVTTTKDVPPDVRAAALWLKFRRGEMWDRRSEDGGEIDVEKEIAGFDEEANQPEDE